MDAIWCGQLAVSTFFAIAFLQSAADKWFDSAGNIEFFSGHFSNSPLAGMVPVMFWTITLLESLAGVLSGLGALMILLGMGTGMAVWGLIFSTVSLLCLFLGQRLAKDYAGAAVIAAYFAVALLGFAVLSSVGG